MEVKLERELFVCACGDVEHQFVISKFEDEPQFYIEMHLSDASFFRRLMIGLEYIFGKKSKYGAFEEIILHPEDIERLRKVIDKETKPKAKPLSKDTKGALKEG